MTGMLSVWCRRCSGGCPAAGGAEAGGEGGRPAEHAGCSGEGAGRANASARAQQEKGETKLAINLFVGYDLPLPLIAARCC